jgi:hypothetical protein
MKLTAIAIAAALAAGCSVHDQASFVVGTKIIPATASTGTGGGGVYDPATNETVFGAFDPIFGYVHAVVVENRLSDNSGLGPGRFNTNDFQVEGATITTDVLIGPAQSIGPQTVPANALIKVGESRAVGVTLAQPGAIAAGSVVRFNVQIFGVLLDGTKVKSNRYEYAADAIAGFIPSAPTCTAPQVAAACEGPHQDTTVICK